MVTSAVEDACQVSVTGSGGCSDLGPMDRGYITVLDKKGRHSLFVYTLDHRLLFVSRTVALVSIKKSIGL